MALIMFVIFLVLVFLGVPISFALGISSIFTLLTIGGYPIDIDAQRMFTAVDSFPLMAIPFFMLAGLLMDRGGITKRIINFSLGIVGHIRGALAHVVAVTAVIMGGISGSGVANTAAIGSIMIPEMKKRGYDGPFSAALVACAGSIGLIIPPSIAMIIYGVSAQVSIGDLFMGGIIPGVLIGAGLMIMSYFIARKKNYPVEQRVGIKEIFKRLKRSIWALFMPIIIIVGIRMGVFTPTEGGCVAAVYALIVGVVVHRDIKMSQIMRIFGEAVIITASISFLIATSSLFSWILTAEQIPQMITKLFLSLTDNKYVMLLLVNLLLIFVGMFIDSGPAIILLAPILVPVASAMGINLVQFGVMMVINLTTGLLTPPVGTALFVASNISGVSLGKLSKSILKFLLIMYGVMFLTAYVPFISTWAIPN
jgi:C4-dicarboxylate transporter DctM subunit